MTSRRSFLRAAGLALAGAPRRSHAQHVDPVRRIGVLTPDRPGVKESLAEGLRQLGYAEGQNLHFEYRIAAKEADFALLAAELVKLNPDVIVVVTGRAALALKSATRTIPIVMATSADAVGQGLVASLARPGGNITGLTEMAPDLAAKRLEMLKEAVPRSSRVAVLGCEPESSRVAGQQWLGVQQAAQRIGLQLVPAFVDRSDQLTGAIKRAIEQRTNALLALDCSILSVSLEKVVRMVNDGRVPALYPFPRFVNAGGLMSYGPDSDTLYRRSAVFVDKILKGAKPADLPVEQPTEFDLVVNTKTAKALGVTLPSSLLLRASRLIE
jgi:putative ABC transport system substrate-binding protein